MMEVNVVTIFMVLISVEDCGCRGDRNPPASTSVVAVGHAVDRASKVVTDQQRTVFHHRHIHGAAAVNAILVYPAFSKYFVFVSIAIGFEWNEVNQGAARLGAVP